MVCWGGHVFFQMHIFKNRTCFLAFFLGDEEKYRIIFRQGSFCGRQRKQKYCISFLAIAPLHVFDADTVCH
jgi:hypothetical protein